MHRARLYGECLAWVLPGILGLLAAALVLLGNATYGPVGDWDSITSLSHMGQIGAGRLPSHATPPGYAVVCWLVHAVFGLSPILAAGWVSAIAFGLTVLVATYWLRSAGASSLAVLWCGVVCTLSPLAIIAGEVMTDPLFILWVMLTLFWLDRSLASWAGRRWIFLGLAAFAAASACLTRLVGVAVIASGAIFLLVASKPALKATRRPYPPARHSTAVVRVATAAAFTAAASAPLLGWVLYADIPLDQELRHSEDFRLSSSLEMAVRTLAEWTFGPHAARDESSAWNQWTRFSSPWLSALASLGGVMGFLAVLVVPIAVVAKGESHRPPSVRAVGANGLFLLCYPAVLLALLSFRDLGLAPRYLLPMYTPGALILALALQTHGHHIRPLLSYIPGLKKAGAPGIGAASVVALAGLTVFLVWQGVRLPQLATQKYEAIRNDLTLGRRLSSKRYNSSDTVRYLAQNLSDVRLFVTNRPHVLIWHLDPLRERIAMRGTENVPVAPVAESADAPASTWWPARTTHRRGPGTDAASHLVWLYPDGDGYPDWVDVCHEQQQFDAIIDDADMQVVAALADGIVMRNVEPGLPAQEVRAVSLLGFVGDSRPIYESAEVAVYLADDRIIYTMDVTDSAACPCGDFPFFLHVDPVNPDDLPEWRTGHDFDNLDHLFRQQPWRYLNAACGAAIPLPDYAVRSLRTGESNLAADGVWKVDWSVEVSLVSDGIPERGPTGSGDADARGARR